MAKKDSITPKICKKCIYKNDCQDGPSSCEFAGKEPTMEEKLEERLAKQKFREGLKKRGY